MKVIVGYLLLVVVQREEISCACRRSQCRRSTSPDPQLPVPSSAAYEPALLGLYRLHTCWHSTHTGLCTAAYPLPRPCLVGIALPSRGGGGMATSSVIPGRLPACPHDHLWPARPGM
jgi:hypothetical protein